MYICICICVYMYIYVYIEKLILINIEYGCEFHLATDAVNMFMLHFLIQRCLSMIMIIIRKRICDFSLVNLSR